MEKKLLGFINDCDFGDVPCYYYPEAKTITADGLTITEVPDDWSMDMLELAWDTFKYWYCEYGAIAATYEQIPYLNHMISDTTA